MIINYKDGSNRLDKNYKVDDKGSSAKDSNSKDNDKDKNFTSLEDFTSGFSGNNESENGTRSAVETTKTYIGNRNSHVFHRPDCDSVKDMKEKNKVVLEGTPEEIENQGFRPCQRCNP